jgi:integrase
MRVRDLWHDAKTGERTARYGTGLRWQAIWDDPSGRERTRSFERKVQAERHLASAVSDVLQGRWVDPRSGRMTVEQFGSAWLPKQLHLRPNTYRQYETNLRLYVYPAIGHLPLAAVDQAAVQSLFTRLAGGDLAASSIELAHRVTTVLFRAAVAEKRLTADPAAKVNLPEVGDDPVVPLRVEHVRALHDALPPRTAILALLGAGTGLRPSELVGVELDPRRSLDMLRRMVLVRQQLLRRRGGTYLGRPKSRKSVRDVPASRATVGYVAEYLARFPAREVLIEDRTGKTVRSRSALFLVTGPRGHPITASQLQRAFRVAVPVARAAIDAELARQVRARELSEEEAARRRMPDHVVPHTLRHTYASWLIARGVHAKVIQERLGHATIQETMDTYGHLFPDEADRTRDAIDDAWGEDETEPERNEADGAGS